MCYYHQIIFSHIIKLYFRKKFKWLYYEQLGIYYNTVGLEKCILIVYFIWHPSLVHRHFYGYITSDRRKWRYYAASRVRPHLIRILYYIYMYRYILKTCTCGSSNQTLSSNRLISALSNTHKTLHPSHTSPNYQPPTPVFINEQSEKLFLRAMLYQMSSSLATVNFHYSYALSYSLSLSSLNDGDVGGGVPTLSHLQSNRYTPQKYPRTDAPPLSFGGSECPT